MTISKKMLPVFSRYFCLLIVTALFTIPAAGLETFRLISPGSPFEKESSPNENSSKSPFNESKEDSIHERRKFHYHKHQHHKHQTEIWQTLAIPEELVAPVRSEWFNVNWTPYWLDYIPILRAPPTIS